VSTTRLARLVLGAMIFVLAGAGIATAQTAPGSSSTVAQTTPQKKDPPKKPWITVHLTPQWKYMLGTSDLPRPNTICSGGSCGATGNYLYAQGQTRLGYGFNASLGGALTLNYSHYYVDQTIGRVTNAANEYVYQVFNDDRYDQVDLIYPVAGVALDLGYRQRVRQCCGNLAGQANKNQWHEYYFQATDRFLGPKSKYFGKLIGITIKPAWIPHDNQLVCGNLPAKTYDAMGCASGNAYFSNPACTLKPASLCFLPQNGAFPNSGDKWHVLGLFNITYPVGGPKSPFAVYGQYFNDYDYFLNAPGMFLYNRVDFGWIYHLGTFMTLSMTDTNLCQHKTGFPFVYPNTVNRNRLDLSADIALPVY
jgi:hypothetical protein